MVLSDRAELKYLVERQREELRTINEVGRLLGTTTHPREVTRVVATYLRQVLPISLCAVLLLERKTLQTVQFAKIAQVDASAALRKIVSEPTKDFPAFLKEEEFTRTEEDLSGTPGQWAQSAAGYLRSQHFVPLSFNGKTMGRLGVFSVKEDAFSSQDRHVIDIVADQLAAGLHNAFLLDELKRADQMKTDLLAIISHELRIPLTAIQEGTSLVLDGSLGAVNEEQSDFLKAIQKNSQRLQELIEEVELAAQIIAGKTQYRTEPVDLSALLKELETSYRPLAEPRKVRLSLSGVDRPVPCTADKKHLGQALGQIVENAIQASPPDGTVSTSVSEDLNEIVIRITDTGHGIPAEEIPRRFDSFFQVGGTADRKTGGLGLGLFVAHKVVTAHQGTLGLESVIGQGTRVTVRLPKGNSSI